MGIEGLGRIHWILIGTVLGVLIAVAFLLAQDTQGEGDQARFEQDVALKDPKSNNPLIKNIVIHPSEVDYQNKTKTLVSYKRLAQDKKGNLGWLDRHFIAPVPYKPMARGVSGMNDPNFTIEDYLTELAKQPNNDFIKFTFGWWYVPSRAITAGGVGGALLIGGLWPTLLSLMAGAGFGRKITAEERQRMAEEKANRKANSLWRYKSKSSKSSTGPTGKPVITAADREELQAVADAYERNVGANAVESSGTSKAGAATQATQEVKKLDTGPLQEVTKQEQDDAELKMREYYPTVVRHKKDEKNENKKDGPASKH